MSVLFYCISLYANKGQVLMAACQRRQIKRAYEFPLKLRKCRRSLRTKGTTLCLLGDIENPQVSHIFPRAGRISAAVVICLHYAIWRHLGISVWKLWEGLFKGLCNLWMFYARHKKVRSCFQHYYFLIIRSKIGDFKGWNLVLCYNPGNHRMCGLK